MSLPDDRWRPLHHVTVPSGWLNDPNGLSCVDGTYHLFHQFHAARAEWGTIEWGHLTSTDLVHWTRQPVALSPTPGADADGCWSGCMVFDGVRPTAVYTGVVQIGPRAYTQSVCLARGDRSLQHLVRDPASPVIAGPPHGLDTIGFRDPFVWRDGDGWAMVIGTGLGERGGAALLYRSPDLLDWTYIGQLYARAADAQDPIWTGRLWECPHFLSLGDRHVLIFSVWDDRASARLNYTVAALGTFDGQRFTPDRLQRFDFGHEYYAPAAFVAPDGRRLAWGWSWEGLTEPARLAQGWAGCLTFPRELSLTADGQLGIAPVPELNALRGEPSVLEQRTLGPERIWSPVRGDVLDLELRVDLDAAARVNLTIAASPDGAETTSITFDRQSGRLELDRGRSSLLDGALGGVCGGQLDLAPDESLELRVLFDRSIVEIFANGRFALTERIYPTRPDSTGVAISAEGGQARLDYLRVWDTRSVSANAPSDAPGG